MSVIRDTRDPQAARARGSRPVLALVAVLGAGAIVGGLVVTAGGGPSREEIVAERGAQVMPFDLDATTHVFDATETGGIQTVVAGNPGDPGQVALIRSHLGTEVERFRAGDFGDPAAIHGHDMPGLATLEARAAEIAIEYRDVAGGGEITYRAEETVLIAALHDWFDAQLADHARHARPE